MYFYLFNVIHSVCFCMFFICLLVSFLYVFKKYYFKKVYKYTILLKNKHTERITYYKVSFMKSDRGNKNDTFTIMGGLANIF